LEYVEETEYLNLREILIQKEDEKKQTER